MTAKEWAAALLVGLGLSGLIVFWGVSVSQDLPDRGSTCSEAR